MELREANIELKEALSKMEESRLSEQALQKELECWVPPFLLHALKEDGLSFPIKKDLVGITFDIVQSSKLHGVVSSSGVPVRSPCFRLFLNAF